MRRLELGLARWMLRIASWVVPRSDRAEWRAEWEAELTALEAGGPEGSPGPFRFVVGCWLHAMWARREAWTLEALWTETRLAARGLARNPTFTLVSVVTIGLGIGANAAVFTLVNGLLWRPPAGVEAPRSRPIGAWSRSSCSGAGSRPCS